MIKVLESVVLKGTCLNTIKGIYKKIAVNIILHGENLQETTLKRGTRQGYPLSQLLLSTVIEIQTGTQIEKEAKLSLFAGDMIQCIRDPKKSIKKHLKTILKIQWYGRVNLHK